ncbi:MAG: iron ABC transporter, partial [Actinomyces bouchesdurhonensis]|nr:iron ABC transporter [Actinomyces bouchesdurhonensis]
MRWTTTSTWIRIVVLFGIYLLIPAAWFGVSRISDSMEIVKSLVFLILLVILPLLAIVVGAWDGVKEG